MNRQPKNKHDPNAIAVYLRKPRAFGLLGSAKIEIGYIKAPAAKDLAKTMDTGNPVIAQVVSSFAPPDKEFPRVSLEVTYDE